MRPARSWLGTFAARCPGPFDCCGDLSLWCLEGSARDGDRGVGVGSRGHGPDDQYRQPRRRRQHPGHVGRNARNQPRGSRPASSSPRRNGAAATLRRLAQSRQRQRLPLRCQSLEPELAVRGSRPLRRSATPALKYTRNPDRARGGYSSRKPARRRPAYSVFSARAVNRGLV